MAINVAINYTWFNYLKENLEATDDELNYLKKLHGIASSQIISEMQHETSPLPSVIIDDFLYQGNLDHANNMKLLRELGIKHIINVCDFRLKKEILKAFDVLWIDLHDIPLADISQHFNATNEFLNACKSKKEKVLVHCQMGVSRSSTIVLAYLLKYYGKNLAEAYDYLLKRRDVVEPNDGFFLQLMRFEKTLLRTSSCDEISVSSETSNNKVLSSATANSTNTEDIK